jgi:predicted nucleic acid-binding protein
VLQKLLSNELHAVATEALFNEYREVLGRAPQLQASWTSREEIDIVLSTLASSITPVPVYFRWCPQLKDANDELVLECAVNAMTAHIVTFNVADFLPGAMRFGIDVLTPAHLLLRMRLST